MRPVSLHLEGFTAFRDATDIDFEGVDLFALTGPTGSGKSSIIDAICFALYGCIPRLTGVAPVVSLGKPEARIRLVFEVEASMYTVSRLVVRQGDGASQRDVRFEGPGFAVAGVREVDARIEALLGLGFDHFTRAVVLPQGKFAAFLEDGPAARERLLKQLLDLGVYEEMRKLGASHAARLEGELALVDVQLHDLLVEPGDVQDAEERLGHLVALREVVTEASGTEDKINTALAAAREQRDSRTRDIDRLELVKPPEDLGRLAEELAAARVAATSAAAAHGEVQAALSDLAERRAVYGEIAALDRAVEAHGRFVELQKRAEKGREVVAVARTKHREAAALLEQAEAKRQTAADQLRQVDQRHAAHGLRTELSEGDDCPVCLQKVGTLPEEAHLPDLEAARLALTDASAARDEVTAQLAAITAELARLEGHLDQLTAELAEAESTASGLPPLAEVLEAREKASGLDLEVANLTAKLAIARAARDESTARLEQAEKAGDVAAAALDRARDTLGGLDPPVPTRVDPGRDWEGLLEWCRIRATELRTEHREAETEVARHTAELQELRDTLRSAADAAGLRDTSGDLKVAVATAIATTDVTLARLRTDLAKKIDLTDRRKILDLDRVRYDETAKLLRSNRFQQWLIEESLVGLVAFANAELAKLADGAYSLVVDKGEFEVIDHRNAEARRSVKTLSGGETFLVSLALALALAERVVATSAIGTARIESLFLDEGFGTLDADTLDTVASVVQELGSRDRMIGLVTHVRELADQIPTRFEVKRLPDGATITRIDS